MALRHRQLSYGQPVPQDWFDAVQEFIGPALNNLRLELANPTTVRCPASSGDQVSVGIMGRWRYNTADAVAAHPGGQPGQYDVYVTAADNSFTLGGPIGEIDNTDYSFGLSIRAQAGGGGQSPPGTPLYRKIAEATWNGTAIIALTMTQGTMPVGSTFTGVSRAAAMLLGGEA